MKERIISDTGPLISLEKLTDGYQFIRKLYEVIIIPEMVAMELAQGQFTNIKASFIIIVLLTSLRSKRQKHQN